MYYKEPPKTHPDRPSPAHNPEIHHRKLIYIFQSKSRITILIKRKYGRRTAGKANGEIIERIEKELNIYVSLTKDRYEQRKAFKIIIKK